MQSTEIQLENMLHEPVPKLLIRLSIPTVVSMLVSNLYNLVDTAFVGTVGTSASGAVGIVFGFLSILQAIGFMMGQGAGSIISRKLGAHDFENASTVASTALFLSFSTGLVTGGICFIFLSPLITLLGSTPTIAPYAKSYITYILAVAPFYVCSLTLNNLLRYEGKAFFSMIGLMTGAILNIFGDMLFMFVFKMGVAGAGLSTAISQLVGFSILLYPFLMGKTMCKPSFQKISRRGKDIFDIVTTGLPSLLRQGLNSVAAIVLNTQASLYGDAAVAGMSIVSRLFFFVLSLSIGIGQGFQPIGGFCFGSRDFKRLKKAFRFTVLLCQVIVMAGGAYVFFHAEYLVGLLREDPEVIRIGTRALRLQCAAGIFLPLSMATEMLLQSTGKKVPAALLASLRSGLIFIPMLFILSHLRGLAGIQEAQPLSHLLAFIPTVLFSVFFFKKHAG